MADTFYDFLSNLGTPVRRPKINYTPVEMFQPEYLPVPLPVDTSIPQGMIERSIRPSMPVQENLLPMPQKAVAPKIDFNQFPIPTPPPVERMPMRDLAGERRQQSKVSLRAGLIGLLLGGGTGALGALTGAQQGFQQAADQDYAQRMAEFQGQQQQAQQEYANRVAMTNAMLNRAQVERQQGQEFLDVDYANAVARRNEQARLQAEEVARAKRAGEITSEEADRRIKQIEAASKFAEPSGVMDFLRTGTIPAEGFGVTARQVTADTQFFRNMAKDLFGKYSMNPSVFKQEAIKFNQSVDQSNLPDAVKASLKVAETEIASPALMNLRLRQQQIEEDIRQFGLDYALRKDRERNAQEEREWRRNFENRRQAADARIKDINAKIRQAELDAKKSGLDPKKATEEARKITAGEITAAAKDFNDMAAELTAILKELSSKIRPAMMTEEYVSGQRAKLEALRTALKTYASNPNYKKYMTFVIDDKANVYRASPGLKTATGRPIENPPAKGGAGLTAEELARKYGATRVK